jgi:predicted ATPase
MSNLLAAVAEAERPILTSSRGLIERDWALEALESSIDAARLGAGSGVFIDATTGSGKSSLLAATAEMAEQADMHLLTASATELEREFAFGLVIQLFEPLWLTLSARDREALRTGPTAAASQLLDGNVTDALPAASERTYTITRGLVWLLRNLRMMPSAAPAASLAILVDDVHCADLPSLRFLAYLAERLKDLPVAMVVTARRGDRAEDPQALALIKSRADTVLRPTALSSEGVERMVRRQFPAALAGFCSACETATGGNPALLHALLDQPLTESAESAVGSLSTLEIESVCDAVAIRLMAMAPPARAVVKAAAVIGDGATIEQVAALTGLEIDSVLETADALAAIELLRPGAPLSFAHPLVRTAVYASLRSLERSEAHRKLAIILAEGVEPSEYIVPDAVSGEPGEDQRAIEVLRAAANTSARAARAGVGKALQRTPPPPDSLRESRRPRQPWWGSH